MKFLVRHRFLMCGTSNEDFWFALSIIPPENSLSLVLLFNKYIEMFLSIIEGFVEVQVG